MKLILVGEYSLNKDSIKLIERVYKNDLYGMDFYCNYGDKGTVIHIDFDDLLAKDDRASKFTYNFILSYIIHKENGILNIDTLMHSTARLYRRCIEVCIVKYKGLKHLEDLKEVILVNYKSCLLELAQSLLV